MKIALITIHRTGNYGAVLQAYATKKILSRYGEVSTVDYDNRHLAHHLDLLRFNFSARGVMMLGHDLLRLPYRIRAVNKIRKFLNENMNLTPRLKERDLIQGKAGEFDIYVCGSDQIWNPEIVSESGQIDPIFFLSFAPQGSTKISYASSIGHHAFSISEKKQVSDLLKDFTLVTTRESDGVVKLSEILPGKDVYHVLDPTLLLTMEEWYDAFNIEPKLDRDKYILLYSVPRTPLIKKAVGFFEKKLGFQVVAIDQMLFPLTKADTHIRDAGPREFIDLFANAEFVITDSFHGTCFALNFGKNFVAISPENRSNRIASLLNALNCSERMINHEDQFLSYNLSANSELQGEFLKSSRINSLDLLCRSISGQ